MAGLVAGITGGASTVVSAITGVATSAIGAAKDALGIHSPSKVFADIGDNTAAGFAEGVEEGAPEAKTALESMVEPPAPTAGGSASPVVSAPAAPASSGGGGGASISGNTFIFNGVKDAEHAQAELEEALTRLLEGDALQASGSAENA
jgi:hypothetical protein